MLYPTFGLITKTNNFNPPFGFSLNDFERFARENPEDAAAIEFLLNAPTGVIAVAQIITGSYTNYGRISMYTGLQSVLGWPGHESQWRGGFEPQGTRLQDLEILYTTNDREVAKGIINFYNIRYIVIGDLERITYNVNEEKFYLYLTPIFQQGNTVIYEVP